MQTFIIILGLLIIILVLLAFFLQDRHYRTIDTLNHLKVDVYNDSVDDLFVQADEVKFSGSSEDEFERVRQRWNRVQEVNYPSIANAIFQAEKATDIFRLMKAHHLEKESEALIAETNQEIIAIKQKVNKFLEAAENNQEKMAELKGKYQALRRELLTQSYRFTPTVQGLDQQLKAIEDDFDQFAIYTSQGDHVEAKTYLDHLRSKIKKTTQYMRKIPTYLDKLKQSYPKDFDQLKSGYRQLKSQNIAFKNDTVLEDIAKIEDQAEVMHQYVSELNLKEAQEEMKIIESRLDQLYDLMETEYQAQQKVKGQFSRLSEIFDVLYERNRQIKIETDRMSQLYHLNDDVLSFGAKNSQSIAESENAFQRLRSDVAQKQVIYSSLSDMVDIVFHKAENIYDNQQAFLDQLYGLADEEKKIKADVDDFAYRMAQMNQRLDRSNLPGAKDDFYDLFVYTTNRIHDLGLEIDRVRLDMGEITYLHNILLQDVPHLEQECDDMFKYAHATEVIIQHLNKYRSQHPELDEEMAMMSHYYYTEYNYERAFKLASQSLQAVAPHEMEEVKNQLHDALA